MTISKRLLLLLCCMPALINGMEQGQSSNKSCLNKYLPFAYSIPIIGAFYLGTHYGKSLPITLPIRSIAPSITGQELVQAYASNFEILEAELSNSGFRYTVQAAIGSMAASFILDKIFNEAYRFKKSHKNLFLIGTGIGVMGLVATTGLLAYWGILAGKGSKIFNISWDLRNEIAAKWLDAKLALVVDANKEQIIKIVHEHYANLPLGVILTAGKK